MLVLLLVTVSVAGATHRSLQVETIRLLGNPQETIQPIFFGIDDSNDHIFVDAIIPELGIKAPEREARKGFATTLLDVQGAPPGEYLIMLRVRDKDSDRNRRKFRWITIT